MEPLRNSLAPPGPNQCCQEPTTSISGDSNLPRISSMLWLAEDLTSKYFKQIVLDNVLRQI